MSSRILFKDLKFCESFKEIVPRFSKVLQQGQSIIMTYRMSAILHRKNCLRITSSLLVPYQILKEKCVLSERKEREALGAI